MKNFAHIMLTVMSFYTPGSSFACFNCTSMSSPNCSLDQLTALSEDVVECSGACITWAITFANALHVERGCVSHSPKLNQTLDLSCEFVRQTLYSQGGTLDLCATCYAPFCNSRSAIAMEEDPVTSPANINYVTAILVSCVLMLMTSLVNRNHVAAILVSCVLMVMTSLGIT